MKKEEEEKSDRFIPPSSTFPHPKVDAKKCAIHSQNGDNGEGDPSWENTRVSQKYMKIQKVDLRHLTFSVCFMFQLICEWQNWPDL